MRDGGRSAHLSRRQLRRLRRSLAREQVRRVAIALISSALPEGSRKNIVACSPGSPLKRTVGGIAKSTPAAVSRAASASHSAIVSTAPKCGTGTSWPSTGLLRASRHRAGREMGDDLVAEEIEIDPFVRAAPLRAAEQPAVESARGVEIVDREGEVEGRHAVPLARPALREPGLRRAVATARRPGLPAPANLIPWRA